MSLLDYAWNADQESRLNELEKKVETLQKQNDLLYEWVMYFVKQMNIETSE